jgi:hypothetical protein
MSAKPKKRKATPSKPIERKIPVIILDAGTKDERQLTGGLLFAYIFSFYNAGINRRHLEETLPLDWVEQFKEMRLEIKANKAREKLAKFKARIDQNYVDYMASPEWKSLRKRILSTRNKCEKCGASDCELHLHHLTYENFKHEKDEDMQVLCYDCHSEVHGRKVGYRRAKAI